MVFMIHIQFLNKYISIFTAQEVITRDCLSNFRAFRTDIPADTYEGCRPAAKDVNLAHYVNNSIKELDIRRLAELLHFIPLLQLLQYVFFQTSLLFHISISFFSLCLC